MEPITEKTVLFLAYYYPPSGSIGSHRSAKFAQYLPDCGWRPIVVTPRDGHQYMDAGLDDCTGRGIRIIRTANFDLSSIVKRVIPASKRIAAVDHGSDTGSNDKRGRRRMLLHIDAVPMLRRFLHTWVYIPDGQIGWYPYACHASMRVLAKQRVDCILSTSFPITAHLVAYELKRATGIPWVADFRDPWSESANLGYSNHLRKLVDRRIERKLLHGADALVTVSRGLAQDFSRLAGGYCRVEVIRNGFDADEFADIEHLKPDKWTITYLATVASSGDITPFLKSLARMIGAGMIQKEDVRFQIVGDPAPFVRDLVARFGVSDITCFTGFVAHRKALALQVNSSLLLFSLYGPGEYPGSISGKLYEHLGARTPILALTYPHYEAAQIIRETSAGTVAEPDDEKLIERCLARSYWKFKSGQERSKPHIDLSAFERYSTARQLASVMSGLAYGREHGRLVKPRSNEDRSFESGHSPA